MVKVIYLIYLAVVLLGQMEVGFSTPITPTSISTPMVEEIQKNGKKLGMITSIDFEKFLQGYSYGDKFFIVGGSGAKNPRMLPPWNGISSAAIDPICDNYRRRSYQNGAESVGAVLFLSLPKILNYIPSGGRLGRFVHTLLGPLAFFSTAPLVIKHMDGHVNSRSSLLVDFRAQSYLKTLSTEGKVVVHNELTLRPVVNDLLHIFPNTKERRIDWIIDPNDSIDKIDQKD